MMSSIPIKNLMIMLTAIGVCGMLGTVEPSVQAAGLTPAQDAQERARIHAYYAWCNAPWTGDDRPYAHLRADIEREATDGEKAVALMRQNGAQLAKEPHDFQAQFAYYYAAYLAVILPGGLTTPQDRDRLGNLYLAIGRVPYPRTYNYARLAFLLAVQGFPAPELKPLGLRLMHQDPNDYRTTYSTIPVLLMTNKPSDRALALTIAQGLVNRYPEKPSVYGQLAAVHYAMWFTNKNPAEAKEATVYYREYLRRAPADDPFRAEAERLIAVMEKG